MSTFAPYRQALGKSINKEWDWDSDNLRMTLHTSSYTPNLDTHDYANDLTNELATAAGYTVGGVALTTRTANTTAANSWAVQRANSTAYVVEQVVRPVSANGFLYRVVVAGTSAGSIPTYPTVIGSTVTDGGVTWQCAGRSITVLTSDAASWASATFTGVRYGVIQANTGTSSTSPLIALVDMVSNQAGLGGTFSQPPDANQGWFSLLVA